MCGRCSWKKLAFVMAAVLLLVTGCMVPAMASEVPEEWGLPITTYEYDFSKEYSWASPEYKNAGFAGLLDTFLCGTYLTKIFGLNDPESIEYGIARAQRIIHGACKVYGTLYALNHKDNIADAVYVCLSQSEGLMVFDIVQVIEFNQWTAIKEGIQRAESL